MKIGRNRHIFQVYFNGKCIFPMIFQHESMEKGIFPICQMHRNSSLWESKIHMDLKTPWGQCSSYRFKLNILFNKEFELSFNEQLILTIACIYFDLILTKFKAVKPRGSSI